MAPAQGWHAKSWSVPNFLIFYFDPEFIPVTLRKCKKVIDGFSKNFSKSGRIIAKWFRNVMWNLVSYNLLPKVTCICNRPSSRFYQPKSRPLSPNKTALMPPLIGQFPPILIPMFRDKTTVKSKLPVWPRIKSVLTEVLPVFETQSKISRFSASMWAKQ